MTLYKYAPHNKCHKYDIILKNELWFASIKSLNDPLDSNLLYRKKYSDYEIQATWEKVVKNKPTPNLEQLMKLYSTNDAFIKERGKDNVKLKTKMGVLCLSKNPKNILMWSHYANAHKGIVYEFETENLFSKDELNGDIMPMEYCCEYKLLSYAAVGKDNSAQIAKELLTKAKNWEYEEEYRYIDLDVNRNRAKKFNPKCLTSIIFGSKTEQNEIDTIKECCKKFNLKHIQFKQAKFIEGKFELEIDPI